MALPPPPEPEDGGAARDAGAGPDGGTRPDAGAPLGDRRVVLQVVRSVDGRVGVGHQLFDRTLGVPCAPLGLLTSSEPIRCRPLPSTPALEALDDEALAPLTPVRERRAELFVDRLTTEDGLDVIVGLVDRTSGARCEPGLTRAGPRCVPELQPITEPLLLDATCTRPVLLAYGPVKVGRVPETGEFLRFEDRGALYEGEVGRWVDGRCVREPVFSDRRTYHVGTPYPPEAWPTVTFADETSGGVTHRVAMTAHGDRLAPSMFVPVSWGQAGGWGRADSLWAGGARCDPLSVDGALRCVPGPRPERTSFADARCAVRAAVDVPGGLTSLYARDDDGDAASDWIPRGRLFEVTSHGVGWVYARLPTGECVREREITRAVLGAPARRGGEPALVVTLE